MGFDIPRGRILPVDEVDVRLVPAPHPFERENETAIARNWEREVAANPALFNGTVVLLSELSYRERRILGRCHAIGFSTFLYWRRHRPEPAAHCFAHPVLVSSDDALVAARMAAHTANAGSVYFPAGMFEPDDFNADDGFVDLHFNMAREVREETGLDIFDARRDHAFHAFSGEAGTVIFRRYVLEEDAETVAARIRAFIAGQAEPEIEAPVVIRDAADRPEGLKPHMVPMLAWHFGG